MLSFTKITRFHASDIKLI